MMQRKALGRGLSALIQERPIEPKSPTNETTVQGAGGLFHLPVEQLRPNPYQPRQTFDEHKLKELAESIKARGVLQPIVVRQSASGYEVIAGERRWRASKMAGVTTIPAVIRESIADRDALGLSILENVQREDLNPLEEARSYQQLMEAFELTQDEVGRAVGKDRSSITNCLRLLKLPDAVQVFVTEGKVSLGHARAILGLTDTDAQVELARRVATEGLSVRQVEQLVKQAAKLGVKKIGRPAAQSQDPHIASMERELQQRLGTRVRIRHRRTRGQVELEYYTLEQLEQLVGILRGGA